MDEKAKQSDPSEPQRAKLVRRHPVRRWVLGILIAIVPLLILAGLTIQVVLWTAVPQSVVVSQIEQGLGLRIGVSGLSTGWLGHTRMSGVRLALPLQEQAFLTVPAMTVRHTNLLGLILGFDIQIKSVELEEPVLYVRQNGAGQWNLQEVAELLARAGGKQTSEQAAKTTGRPALPRLQINHMTIVILDNRQRELKVTPVNVSGEPETPLSWKYDVEVPSDRKDVPPHLSLLGRVAPGGNWAHEAHIWIHDVAAWIRAWQPQAHEPLDFDGAWSGQLTTNGIQGFLRISQASCGAYHMSGALHAFAESGVYTIAANSLTVTTPRSALGEFGISGGSLTYDGKTFSATHLQLALLGGPATLDGSYQPSARQGSLQAQWQHLAFGKGKFEVSSGGRLQLSYFAPRAANLTIAGVIDTRGIAAGDPYEIVGDFGAQGPEARDLTWQFTTHALAWYRPQAIVLNGLAATGAYQQDAQHKSVRLLSLSLPADNRLAGRGAYDLFSSQWTVHLEGRDWPVHLVEGTQLGFVLDATGSRVPAPQAAGGRVPLIQVALFTLSSANAHLSMNGRYDGRDSSKPIHMAVRFDSSPSQAAPSSQLPLIRGWLSAQATLEGVLDEQRENLDIAGSVISHDATILGHPVGDMRTLVRGGLDREKAWINADGIPFLDGIWNLDATYVERQGGKNVYATTVALSVDHLPLQRAAQFLNTRQVTGTLAGNWNVYFPGLAPWADQVIVSGGASIRNLAASYFAADEATFRTQMREGTLTIDPIRLSRGRDYRIDAHADLNLGRWRQVHAGVNLTNWRIDVPTAGVTLLVSGGADQIEVSLPDGTAANPAARKLRADADFQFSSSVSIGDQPQGRLHVNAAMNGRTIDLRELSGELLGGTISGDGAWDLDRPVASTANLVWKNVQIDRAVRLYSTLTGFGGTLSGSAHLKPAAEPRPLEPMALDVSLSASGAHWHSVQIGDGQLHAYVGPYRFIAADRQPSTLRVANGDVGVWFSSSTHVDTVPGAAGRPQVTGTTVSNQVNLTLSDLQIDQFVRTFDPTHRRGFGRLSGSLYALTAPKSRTLAEVAQSIASSAPAAVALARQQSLLEALLRTTTVDGTLSLRQSNLANFGPITFLFDVMHLGQNVRTATGSGNLALHMEDGTLHVLDLHYFNRGIEVRGVATIDQMWKVPDSPLHGSALGAARPLRDIRLPLFAETDALFSALQGALTAVQFDNTLRKPGNFQQLRLNQLGSEIRGLLLGEVGANRGSQ